MRRSPLVRLTSALQRRPQRARIGRLLAQMEAEDGPIPAEHLDDARQMWRGDLPSGRRRRG